MTVHNAGVEAEIMRVLEATTAALRDKDLDALARCYAVDVRVYDIGSQLVGFDALRWVWEQCFPYFPKPIGCERKDLLIDAGTDMAVVSFLSRMTGMETDHPSATSWLRTTVCLGKTDSGWKIVHEHASLPVDCLAEKPLYLTDDA